MAAATGIDAETTRRLARELAAADRAVVYGRIGTTTVRFGTVTSWAVDVVNALTGNLDEPGGAMFPRAAHVPDRSGRPPFRTGRWRSRVRDLPEVLGEIPVGTLVDEIETPGDGQVRALITVAGNPVLSTPNGARLDRAIAGLDLVVCIDPYLNATTRHADVLLPPPGAIHRGHYDVAFTTLSVRNVANYSPPVVPLPDGQLDEWEILLTLAGIAAGQGPDVDVDALDDLVARTVLEQQVAAGESRVAGRDADELWAQMKGRRGPERLLDLLLRAGPYGDGFGTHPDGLTLERLEANPHGIDLGALEPRIPDNVITESGLVELAPPTVIADLDRVAAAMDVTPDGLVLVGRRHLRTNNSWNHNLPMLAKGRDLCTLQVHPDDAARLGIAEGGSATVRSRVGEVTVPVEVTEDIAPGVVSLPHGFGHDLPGHRAAGRDPPAGRQQQPPDRRGRPRSALRHRGPERDPGRGRRRPGRPGRARARDGVTDLAGLVLAGGRSRRMGTDKAVLTWDGERLVDRAVRLLGTLCTEVLVASGDGARLDVAVPQVADEPDVDGPLGGLIAGLGALPDRAVAVVAVDAPHLDVAVLRRCAELRDDALVAAPVVDDVVQPLHAVWSSAAVPALRTAAARGERSPRRLVGLLGGRLVLPPEWEPVAHAGGRFATSWNTPGDLPPAR